MVQDGGNLTREKKRDATSQSSVTKTNSRKAIGSQLTMTLEPIYIPIHYKCDATRTRDFIRQLACVIYPYITKVMQIDQGIR